MDTLINILMVIFWNLIIPTLIGYLFTDFIRQDGRDNLVLNFTFGFIAVIGMFQPITLVAIYLKLSLSLLTMIFKLLWVFLSIVSIIKNRKRFIRSIKRITEVLRRFNLFIAVAILLIIVQAYGYVSYEHIDDDDSFFVATATTSVLNDNLYIRSPYSGALYTDLPNRYILSPFSIFYAVMSKLTNLHATIYAHLYLPILLLLFVYLVYYLWGKEWFSSAKSIGVYLILISFLNIFGNYSEFTTQSFLLLRLWQGKAFLAAGMIPFILYLCYRLCKEEHVISLWIGLFLSASAASHVSSMGIFLAPVSIGCWALVDCIQTRKLKRLIAYLLCCLPCIIYGVIYLIISR
jgi:hypothetical protein